MSQATVIKELKKKDWMTVKELNKKLKITSASSNLLKLYKQGIVERKKIRLDSAHKEYRYKLKVL